jgi:hypothetical protein
MKLRVAAAILSFVATACAFSVTPRATTTTTTTRSVRRWLVVVAESASNTVANDFETTAAAATDVGVVSIWDQLGIPQGNLALGVKPDEVLKYIGT